MKIQGEVWNAVAADEVEVGEEVTVLQTRGLELTVCKDRGTGKDHPLYN